MPNRPKVGEILLQAGVIDEFQLKAALGEQVRWGRRLGVALVKLGFVEERDLARALAAQLDLPVARLEGKRILPQVLDLVPRKVAEQNMVMPLFVKDEGGSECLFLGMEDPSDIEVLDDLAFRTGMEIRPVMVCASDLCEAIDRHYCRPSPTELEVAGDSAADSMLKPGDELDPDEERTEPVIRDRASAESTAQAESADGAVTAGTRELTRHWAARESADESEEETLPDAGAALRTTVSAADPEPDHRQTGLADTAVELALDEAGGIAPHSCDSQYDSKTRTILRALTQLMIEKGVMTRQEFHARVRDLQDSEAESG